MSNILTFSISTESELKFHPSFYWWQIHKHPTGVPRTQTHMTSALKQYHFQENRTHRHTIVQRYVNAPRMGPDFQRRALPTPFLRLIHTGQLNGASAPHDASNGHSATSTGRAGRCGCESQHVERVVYVCEPAAMTRHQFHIVVTLLLYWQAHTHTHTHTHIHTLRGRNGRCAPRAHSFKRYTQILPPIR